MGWSPDPDVTLSWSSRDASGSPASGSVLVTHQGATPTIGADQWAPATPGTKPLLLRVFTPSAQATTGHSYGGLRFLASSDCTGDVTGGYASSLPSEADKWTTALQTNQVAPAGTRSVLVTLQLTKGVAVGSFQVYFDDVAVLSADPQTTRGLHVGLGSNGGDLTGGFVEAGRQELSDKGGAEEGAGPVQPPRPRRRLRHRPRPRRGRAREAVARPGEDGAQ